MNQYEINSRSQIDGHDQQLSDIMICIKFKTHNQLGVNEYEGCQTTHGNILEVQYNFKIIKISVWEVTKILVVS